MPPPDHEEVRPAGNQADSETTTGADVSTIVRRLPPDIAEALRLLDTLPPNTTHGYWSENGTLTDRPITTDELKQAFIGGEYTPQQIRNHVALMRYALSGGT